MVKVSLVGDIFISRPFPEKGYGFLDDITHLLNDHDVRFANLETTVHRREGYPSAYPGGTWSMADPLCLDSIKRLGINVVNTANNHALDYSQNGLLATQRYLARSKIPYMGTGKNLSDAAAPVFIECSGARVALIGATSSFHDSDAAGYQRCNMKGRPGVNPLRHKSICQITEEDYRHLLKIAKETGINDYHDQAIKEGYLLPNKNFQFAGTEFVIGEENTLKTFPLDSDMLRIENSIKEAKKQADYVIVSIHNHQFSRGQKKYPAEFIRKFSRNCIEAGAIIVVGHGPHVLRGIEAYEKGIIFYGLGNFIFQNESIAYLPEDFYQKYSIEPTAGTGTALSRRNRNGEIGLKKEEESWQSVIASVTIDDERVAIKLYPVEIGNDDPHYSRGIPKLINDSVILRNLDELSKEYGTAIDIKDGVGSLELMH